MAQGSDTPQEQPQDPGAPSPPAGAPASSPRLPYGTGAPSDATPGVPTPPSHFVRPASASQPPQQKPAQPLPAPQGLPQQEPQQTPPQQAPPYGAVQPARRQPAAPPAYPTPNYGAPGYGASGQPSPQPQPRPAPPAAGYPPPSAPPRPPSRNSALRCPNCGGPVTSETESCPTCGESLQAKPRVVRCRHCGKKGSSRLTLCPHCGRTLQPAPSRLLTLGLPLVLGALLLVLLAFQSGSGNPLGWAGGRARAASAWVASLSARLDPQLAVIPAPENNVAAALPTAPVGVAPAATAGPVEPQGGVNDGLAMTNTIIVTAGEPVVGLPLSAIISATAEAVSVAAAVAPAAALSAADEASTVTPLPTLTSLPSATPTSPPTATPSATATLAPINYTVVQGDAAESIAARFGITLDALLLANNLSESDATLLQPGQSLVIPLPGGRNDAATGSVYTVRQGDTLIGIAVKTGVPIDEIQAANGLSNAQAASLQPGDELVIPAPTALPTAEPSATPLPTDTPAPTVTPASSATPAGRATAAPTAAAVAPNGMRLPAPRLRGPLDGVTVACNAGRLQWEPIPGIAGDESYRVHLGFVSGRDASGNTQITWLIQQDIPSTITQVGIPADFCDKSSDAMDNQWRWYVEAVAPSGGATLPVSPTSDVWGFTWRD